jgi:hypothetical protein
LGVGLRIPSRKKITVTKPWRRPRPMQGCSTNEEEEEEMCNIQTVKPDTLSQRNIEI